MAGKDSKFQLPELAPVQFSLTEGTDIPPPPDSPLDDPRPPTPGRGPLSSHPTTPRADKFPSDPLANGANPVEGAAEKLASNDATSPTSKATSPVLSKRPSSVRRFLGLRAPSSSDSLKQSIPGKDRPMSPQSVQTQTSAYTNNTQHSLARKKSTGWFSKRKSMMIITKLDEKAGEDQENHAAPRGPPPPTIPEFTALGAVLDGGDLDADNMFKNIN